MCSRYKVSHTLNNQQRPQVSKEFDDEHPEMRMRLQRGPLTYESIFTTLHEFDHLYHDVTDTVILCTTARMNPKGHM
ncbi:hypothetical protein ACLOJK_036902 [Asimina triloba]